MRIARRLTAFTLVAVVLNHMTGCASEPADKTRPQVRPEATKEIPLFNGKDFTGWTYHSKDPNSRLEDVFSVQDGSIICTGKPAGYIRTEKDYTSYVLKAQWRFSKPGNSGALLRMTGPDKVWPKSIECQLHHQNAGDIWNIDQFPMKTDPSRQQQSRRTVKMKPSNEKPLGEWNQYEITLDGGYLKLVVNGEVQNEAIDCEIVAGKICFQSEGAAIELRNITLTPLPDKGTGTAKPIGTSFEVQKPDPPKVRLEGLKGWHVLGKGNWTYKDGVIEGSQPETTKTYTHVISDKSYKNFKAKLQFKAVKGNSGFYFRVKPEGDSKMLGIQAEIDEKNNVGGMYESYGRNWLSKPTKEDVARFFKPGEWNEMTVEGYGPRVVVHVNGVKASEINDPTIRMEGPFALQIHGGQDVHVMFKDIVLEEK
jgi:hypothetical protein